MAKRLSPQRRTEVVKTLVRTYFKNRPAPNLVQLTRIVAIATTIHPISRDATAAALNDLATELKVWELT